MSQFWHGFICGLPAGAVIGLVYAFAVVTHYKHKEGR